MLILDLSSKLFREQLYVESIIGDLTSGDMLLFIDKYKTGAIAFYYVEDGNLYHINTDGKQKVDFVTDMYWSAVVKTRCMPEYIIDRFSHSKIMFKVYNSTKYMFSCDKTIEITGKELKAGDIVRYISNTNFEIKIGQVMSSNQVILETGEIKRCRLCEKLDSVPYYLGYTQQLLIKAANDEIRPRNKIDREVQAGDVYKRGNTVYICLGKYGIQFSLSNKTLNERVNLNKINAYYNRQSDYLWYKSHISKSEEIYRLVSTLNTYDEWSWDLEDFNSAVINHIGPFSYNYDIQSCYWEPERLCYLMYDMNISRLGDYIGHLDLFELNNKFFSLRATTYIKDINKLVAKLNIKFKGGKV